MNSAALPTPQLLRKRSLNDVRAVIPATCYERSNTKAWLTLAQGAFLYIAPFTLLVRTTQWWAVLLLWLAVGLAIAGLFVLGHDASHGALFDSKRMNRFVARSCMAPSAHVEAAWNLGHNRIHHGYTTREGFDFVWHPTTVEQFAQMSTPGRLRHRFEWSFLGSGAYYLRVVWWGKMWRFAAAGKHRSAIRRDKFTLGFALALTLAVPAIFGVMQDGLLGGIWLTIKLVVVPFLFFIHIIGWTVYIHHVSPDIRWWPRRGWSHFAAQMESTTIFQMPRLINRLWFHNIFVHIPHHVDARIPFHQLVHAATAIAGMYPDIVKVKRFSIIRYVRSTRSCKLYDFEAGCWLSYAAAAV